MGEGARDEEGLKAYPPPPQNLLAKNLQSFCNFFLPKKLKFGRKNGLF
jgi:hypothetical protein